MVRSLRTLLLASLMAAAPIAALAQTAIDQGTVRGAQVSGPTRISVATGFNVSAGAPTAAFDLVDVRPSDAFVIEGPIRMAIEGFVVFVVDCAVYSDNRIIARFNRGAPVLDGPFAGRFRFGLARTGQGVATSYGCWATAFGARDGANWRAYEEPNASIPGGYVQLIKMENGAFWNGAPITEQVVLHVTGPLGGVSAPGAPSAAGLVTGPQIPDGSDVQWRPPIIPPGYGAQIAAARAGQGKGGWNSATDYLRGGNAGATDYLRGPALTNLPVVAPGKVPQP